MKLFEDREYNGVLGEYLENCKKYRVEAIYNTEYRYIKEIIWDTEAQEKFGSDRAGYEKFKADKDYPGNLSYSGEIDLRIRYDKENGSPLGYITESKRTSNDNYKHMLKQLEGAKAKMFEILGVKDTEIFNYWLEEYVGDLFGFSRKGANETIYAIEKLEEIITKYNDPEEKEFKQFLDKIKG